VDRAAAPGPAAAEPDRETRTDQPAAERQRWAPLVVSGIVAVLVGAGAWSVWNRLGSPLPDPTALALTSFLGDERFPTFSPDGNQVAFAWNGSERDNWDIYVKLIGSADAPRRLTSDPADDLMPAWSRDGRQIAFERRRGSQFAVYTISPLGGAERILADGLSASSSVTFSSLSWSLDGQWIVVADWESASETSRLMLVPTGSGVRRVVMSSDRSAGMLLNPAISPDGRALAYELCRPQTVCDVHVVALDSQETPKGEPRRLSHDGHLPCGLAWTRDGRSLIYGDGQRLGLRRVTFGAPEFQRVELAGPGAMFPAVSPAGDRLAYVRSGWDLHLWKFAAGGTGAPEQFLLSTLVDRAPQFSADGRRIVFGSDRAGNGAQLWVADQDGSNPVALTLPTGRAQGTAHWSPDGHWVVYDGQSDDGHRHAYIVDSGGGPPRRITADTSDESFPTWSRDGRWIYFGSMRTGRFEIWRIRSVPGEEVRQSAQQITAAGGYAAWESGNGLALFYTKSSAIEGSVFTQPVAGGAERRVVESVYRWDFFPIDGSLYYITRPDGQRHANAFELRILDAPTGKEAVVNRFDSMDVVGLSVSPDRRTVLSSGMRTTAGDDLMLIQHFR
jgi:Tol biopolymer transport system component